MLTLGIFLNWWIYSFWALLFSPIAISFLWKNILIPWPICSSPLSNLDSHFLISSPSWSSSFSYTRLSPFSFLFFFFSPSFLAAGVTFSTFSFSPSLLLPARYRTSSRCCLPPPPPSSSFSLYFFLSFCKKNFETI